jgi:hypothetical protein
VANFLTISGRTEQRHVATHPHVIARLGDLEIQADAAHPNKLKFTGILVRLDEPSTKPPQGSDGHLIQLPSTLAAKQLDTLIGMGVNYAENLDAHDPAYKVGVIQRAWIKGNALYVSGFVWIGDFPDAQKVLTTPGMGMSMELTKVKVEDPDAEVWVLSNFVFTGATFLRKNAAAYFDTQAIAAAASSLATIFLNTETVMPKTITPTTTKPKKPLTAEQKELAKLAASASTASTTRTLGPVLASIATAMQTSNILNKKILAKLEAPVQATKANADEDEDDMDAAKKKDDNADDSDDSDDDDDDWDEGDDDDDDDDDEDDVDSSNALVDAATDTGTDPDEGDSTMPGHINDDAGSFGNTSELMLKQGPTVSIVKASAAYKKLKAKAVDYRTKYRASAKANVALKAENERLRVRNTTATETVRATAGEAVRRTLSSSSIQLLTKNGVAPDELRASGQKLGNDEVDAMFRNLPTMPDVETRIGMKLELQAAGVMAAPKATTARRTA